MSKVKKSVKNDLVVIENKTELVEIIPQTMDYLKYEIDECYNRNVMPSHIKKIEESLIEFGSAALTIKVIETRATGRLMRVKADGQHSCMAAHRLGLPLNVIVIRLKEDTKFNVTKFVAKLNTTSKSWSPKTHIEKFANCDSANYNFFLSKLKETGLTVTDLCNIYLDGTAATLKKLKEGSISIINVERSEKLLACVMELKQILPNKSFSRRSLFKIFNKCDSNDYQKFVDAVKSATKAPNFTFTENETGLYSQLEDIYISTFAK